MAEAADAESPAVDAESPWPDDDPDDDEDDWGDTPMEDGDDDDWNVEEVDEINLEIEQEEEKGPVFEIHEEAEVLGMIEDNVNNLCELIQDEPKENVRLILQYYKWKPSKANELYYTEIDKARINAGVDPDKCAAPPYDVSDEECLICLDDKGPSDWLALECGHRFCKTCWIETLTQAAKSRDCIKLTCPDVSCKLAMTESRIKKMGLQKINPQRTAFFLEKVRKFRIDNFIACNNTYRFCPGRDCTKIIEIKDSSTLTILCKCGKSFCWKCSRDSHHPAPCKVAEAWAHKNAGATDDDMKWIISNSKKCPGCGYYIERNQGCNHMTCRHPSCGHEFCWMCGADWKTHGAATGGYYKCNIYESKKADVSIYDRERKAKLFQEELKKYRFYFERYHNHLSSMKKMQKDFPEVESKMRKLSAELDWSANEAAFIRDAANCVIKNRHLLSWTYAIGFYCDPDLPTFNLFQKWQGDLDHYTDKLHEFLEKPLEDYLLMEFRTSLKTWTKLIQKYQRELIVGIEEQIIPKAFGKGWKPREIDIDC